MQHARFLVPLAVLGGAAFLALPTRTEAYTTIGGNLGLAQRDFRVFNNFTDPTANDNTTPDANFPGATGVALAMWKANLEWGSRLHGNGNGDPTQPAGLGSGGANFDPSWQGLATGIGGVNDNIISELSGSSGGTLAYCETPIQDGWRIRFYQDAANWSDGPGSPGAGQYDLQGVGTHELGHALGLGHSTVAGATMQAVATVNGANERTINADDIAGVQAIYGVAAATKPIITNVVQSGCSLTITGSNFAPTGNEVWFTRLNNASGDPLKVTNVASVGGTTITLTAPTAAGPGDLLVKIPGSANSALSNAWPVSPQGGTAPQSYCQAAPNSYDIFGATMAYSGSTSIATNNFTLVTNGVPPNAACLYFFGPNQTFAPFGNGYRCVGNPTTRLPIMNASPFGDAAYTLNFTTSPASTIPANSPRNFQLWYRNPAGGGAGFNLSDGLQVTFCP